MTLAETVLSGVPRQAPDAGGAYLGLMGPPLGVGDRATRGEGGQLEKTTAALRAR